MAVATNRFGLIILSLFLNPLVSVGSAWILITWLCRHANIMSIYGRYLAVLIDAGILCFCAWKFVSGWTLLAAGIALIISAGRFAGKDNDLWVSVVQQIDSSASMLARIVYCSAICTLQSLLLVCAVVMRILLIRQEHAGTGVALGFCFFSAFLTFVGRGAIIGYLNNRFFLIDSLLENNDAGQKAVCQLLSMNLGSVVLAALYYGGRTVVLAYSVVPFQEPDMYQDIGYFLVQLYMIMVVSGQKFRPLVSICNQGQSFLKSIMSTEVHHLFKVDLIHHAAAIASYAIAGGVGCANWGIWHRLGLSSQLTWYLSAYASIHSLLLTQHVFELFKSGSTLISVQLAADPATVVKRFPWILAFVT